MVYQFKNGHVTRHTLNNGHESVRSVAIPIDDSHSFGERIIFAMLLDWLENETHARVLVRPTAKMFPNKLGRGETGCFRITTNDLCDAVLEAFNQAAEQKSKPPQIEYLGGIRRDTLRLKA